MNIGMKVIAYAKEQPMAIHIAMRPVLGGKMCVYIQSTAILHVTVAMVHVIPEEYWIRCWKEAFSGDRSVA
jgi:hypothetical protein